MKYSVMVEYAMHSLIHLIDIPEDETIGIKDLAEFQGLSETYLSKVFGKLTKAGIVRSVPGVNGGYRLAKRPEDISFWDVVRAVEGAKPIFQCKNIIANSAIKSTDTNCEECRSSDGSCIINLTMLEAEKQMKLFLEGKTLAWLNDELDRILSAEERTETKAFFKRKNDE